MTAEQDQDAVTFAQFQEIIARELQIDAAAVLEDASFIEDLGADSIQLVNLMLRLEESGIAIPIEAAWEVETVGDAYAVYREHVAP